MCRTRHYFGAERRRNVASLFEKQAERKQQASDCSKEYNLVLKQRLSRSAQDVKKEFRNRKIDLTSFARPALAFDNHLL